MTTTWVLVYFVIGALWSRFLVLKYLDGGRQVKLRTFFLHAVFWPISFMILVLLVIAFAVFHHRRSSDEVNQEKEDALD
jgi:Na+/proline symporter